MVFTNQQLEYQIDCGECALRKLSPDELLSHLVEDHEYTVREAERYLTTVLPDADEKYESQLEAYYEYRRD